MGWTTVNNHWIQDLQKQGWVGWWVLYNNLINLWLCWIMITHESFERQVLEDQIPMYYSEPLPEHLGAGWHHHTPSKAIPPPWIAQPHLPVPGITPLRSDSTCNLWKPLLKRFPCSSSCVILANAGLRRHISEGNMQFHPDKGIINPWNYVCKAALTLVSWTARSPASWTSHLKSR